MASAKTIPPIVIGFFARGLNTNRQPLFSALTGVGLQVIQFKDYLIDGINVECSDHFTLQRAPGFVKYCSAQLAVSEVVNQFYGTRDLSGNVYVLADTNQNLYKVGTGALTSLLTKGTTAQGYIQKVGGVTYYANGTDFKKWIPANGNSMVPMGVAAPLIVPSISPGTGYMAFWSANFVTPSTAVGLLDYNGNIEYSGLGPSKTGAILPTWSTAAVGQTFDGAIRWVSNGPLSPWAASTAYANGSIAVLDANNFIQIIDTPGTSGSTAPSWNATIGGTTTDNTITWLNLGPGIVVAYSGWSYVFAYRTVSGNLSTASPVVSTGPALSSQSIAPLSVTAWSITSNVVTFTAKNNFIAGAQATLDGFGTSTFFNGAVLTVLSSGLSGTQFKANFTHANGSATEAGSANPIIAILSGAASSNAECNSTATITSVTVASGVVTIIANNNFSSGINIQCSGLSTATFLNGVTLQVTSATPTQFTVSLPNQANSGPTSDSGTATFFAVEVYRTQDGGGVYYYDGACLNTSNWQFFDISADAALDVELVCAPPGEHLNDPPPGAAGSTISPGGALMAWWSNRLWMAVGNLVFFCGGPDILNGISEECWPPGNVFAFPGQVTSLKGTTGGLVVVAPEEVWAIIGGPQTVAYYPERILEKFGALSDNCVKQDGDVLYIHNSQRQLTVLSGAGRGELGAGNSGVGPISDLLALGQSTPILTASAWSATASYLAIHRQGQDSGIYLSNGIESYVRYGVNVGNFSPVRQPLVTGSANCGAMNSVETSAGQYSLLMAPTAAHDFIYARSTTTFSDNGHAYASSAVIGNIVVSEPGQVLIPIQYIAAYLFNRGTVPSLSFFPNDVNPTTFIALATALPEPALLPAPANLISKRWPLLMNQNAQSILMRHMQVKVDFGNTDTVKNELIELALIPTVE